MVDQFTEYGIFSKKAFLFCLDSGIVSVDTIVDSIFHSFRQGDHKNIL
jgi:hypothetical protein